MIRLIKRVLSYSIDILEELSALDIKIKSGQIDRYVGFELFLLNACK